LKCHDVAPNYWRIKMPTHAAVPKTIGAIRAPAPALAIAAYVPLSGSFFQQVSERTILFGILCLELAGRSYIFFAATGPSAAGQRTQHWQQLGLTVIIAAKSEVIVAAGGEVPRF
jgi:hypothetical protein